MKNYFVFYQFHNSQTGLDEFDHQEVQALSVDRVFDLIKTWPNQENFLICLILQADNINIEWED